MLKNYNKIRFCKINELRGPSVCTISGPKVVENQILGRGFSEPPYCEVFLDRVKD